MIVLTQNTWQFHPSPAQEPGCGWWSPHPPPRVLALAPGHGDDDDDTHEVNEDDDTYVGDYDGDNHLKLGGLLGHGGQLLPELGLICTH